MDGVPTPKPSQRLSERIPARASQHADKPQVDVATPGRGSLTESHPALDPETSVKRAIHDATRFADALATSLDARDLTRSHILAADLGAALDVAKRGLPLVDSALRDPLARMVNELEVKEDVLRHRLPSWTRDDSRFVGVLAGCAPITSVADAEARLDRALESDGQSGEPLAPMSVWLDRLRLDANLRARLEGASLVDTASTITGLLAGAIGELVQRQRTGALFKGFGPHARKLFHAARSLLRVLAGEAPVKELEMAGAVRDAKRGMLGVVAGVATLTVAGAAAPLIAGEAQLIGWGLQQAWTLMLQNPTTTVAVGEWMLDAVITIGMAGGLVEYAKLIGSDPRALIGAVMMVIHGRGAILSGVVVDAKPNAIVVRTAKQGAEAAPAARTSKAYNRMLSDVPELVELWNKAASKQKPTGDPRKDYDRTRDRFVYALTRNTPAAVAARKVLEHDGFRFLRNKDGSLKCALPLLDLPDLEKYITTSTIDMFRLSFQHMDMLVDGGAPIDPKNLMLMTGRDNNQMDKGPAHIRTKTVDQVRGAK